MTRWVMIVAIMGAAAVVAGTRAEDGKAAAEEFEALTGDFLPKFQKERTPELIKEYSAKFIAHAKKHPKHESAVNALSIVIQVNQGKDRTDSHKEAVDLLKKEYVKSELIRPSLDPFASVGTTDDADVLEVVKAVYKDNPDKRTRALAARAIAKAYEQLGQIAERLDDEKVRANAEKRLGKERVAKLLETAEAAKKGKEAEKYRKALKDDFADVFPDLSVGAKAPATESASLDGKKTALADLEGKVVVLDFWATWCGPCVRTIPQTRELVKKNEGKPFVFVSVSADEKRQTVEDFIKKEKMPWTHWWDGQQGKAAQTWEVEAFPTLYVIDHKGVIRHKEVGASEGEKLAEVVAKLIEEAEADAKKKD